MKYEKKERPRKGPFFYRNNGDILLFLKKAECPRFGLDLEAQNQQRGDDQRKGEQHEERVHPPA
ncbi:MAG: hypothetical protein KJO82_06760, partial [Gammaproteobacteria bacterium]|nr:hypothetical protein [Gammaproteobacteria bacterium]